MVVDVAASHGFLDQYSRIVHLWSFDGRHRSGWAMVRLDMGRRKGCRGVEKHAPSISGVYILRGRNFCESIRMAPARAHLPVFGRQQANRWNARVPIL